MAAVRPSKCSARARKGKVRVMHRVISAPCRVSKAFKLRVLNARAVHGAKNDTAVNTEGRFTTLNG